MLEEKFEYIKIGRILNIDYNAGTCDIATTDKSAGKRKSVIYPYPYAGERKNLKNRRKEILITNYDREMSLFPSHDKIYYIY